MKSSKLQNDLENAVSVMVNHLLFFCHFQCIDRISLMKSCLPLDVSSFLRRVVRHRRFDIVKIEIGRHQPPSSLFAYMLYYACLCFIFFRRPIALYEVNSPFSVLMISMISGFLTGLKLLLDDCYHPFLIQPRIKTRRRRYSDLKSMNQYR